MLVADYFAELFAAGHNRGLICFPELLFAC